MVYEKKMLILSGEGSGVVMIEKSARGVRFALRTLGLARSDNARAGIITRKAVYVRDLPAETDPSAVFYIDDAETDDLHFAVFDARLRLYGTTAATRMWEANVMDLLNKYGAPVVLPARELPSLPPVSAPPKVLPTPDGTGIPQSRLDIYGDDALAENDIYTSIDFSARMREVDGFLDTPRILGATNAAYSITPPRGAKADAATPSHTEAASAETTAAMPRPSALDGLAPHIMPPPDVPAYMLFPPDADASASAAATTDWVREPVADKPSGSEPSVEYAKTDDTAVAVESASVETEQARTQSDGAFDEPASTAQKYETVKRAVAPSDDTASFIYNPVPPSAEGFAQTADEEENGYSAAAATEKVEADTTASADNADGGAEGADAQTDERAADDAVCAMPWELTARWLKSRSERQPVVKRERVHTVEQKTRVAALREVAFFERCRADIEKLFSSAPKDSELTALLPDIEWVRVEFGGHAVGVGRSDNAFLCYAVAGQYEKTSPLGDEAQWLPKLKNAPTGKGYWLIFQDLISGEIIGN